MIVFVWVLNFGISWFNAWACGKTWNETKHHGSWPHFLNWMGAIMSASGFTWCYLVVAAFIGAAIPFEQANDASAPLLTAMELQAFLDLGYMVIIFPVLGSGLAITIHAWGVFWRQRTLANGAIAAYDTFAQVYNTVSALRHVPRASKGLKEFFDGENDLKGVVILLVAIAAIGGILTTWAIVRATSRRTAFERGLEYGT